MPVTYTVDHATGIVHTRCTGDVRLQHVLDHFGDLESDASLPAKVDVLLDLTEMESLPKSDQLREVASELDRLQSKVEWGGFAIVANRDALYGMIRMFEVFAQHVFASTCVFRDMGEAERWLGSLHQTTK